MEFLHYMAIPSHITCYLLCHFDLFSSKPVNQKRKRPFHCISVLPRESEYDWKEYLIEASLQFMQCKFSHIPFFNFPVLDFRGSVLIWLRASVTWDKAKCFSIKHANMRGVTRLQVKFVPIRVQRFLFIEWSYSIPETNSLLPFIKKNDF